MALARPTKCTFGIRNAVDQAQLDQYISREVKNLHNFHDYRPKLDAAPVTGKFYARHDLEVGSTPRYIADLERKPPKYDVPITENMEYGWVPHRLMPINPNDLRFYHPKRESSYTKTELLTRMCNNKIRK